MPDHNHVVIADGHTTVITEEQRQLILLGLAKLAHERPGWQWTLTEVADAFDGRVLFDALLKLEPHRQHVRQEAVSWLGAIAADPRLIPSARAHAAVLLEGEQEP